ncbi:MAG: hypothetical protein OXC19_21635 [Bryobacterales bacterium]|nr:hypothetical protein [Bryobacterales bacterium]
MTPLRRRMSEDMPMAQIVEARAAGIRRAAQADLPGQLHERLLQGVLHDPGAALGQEEGRATGLRAPLIALRGVGFQRLRRRLVNGHQPRLAELALADGQNALVEIDVVPVKAQRLGGAHPAGGEQRQQRGVGARAEPGASGQPPCRFDQVGDLVVTVDVRDCAARLGGEQTSGGTSWRGSAALA